MSQYLSAVAILLMVMSPLLIPATASVVHRTILGEFALSPAGVKPRRPRRFPEAPPTNVDLFKQQVGVRR